jgi:DNA-binding transcriptional LysR family regulator
MQGKVSGQISITPLPIPMMLLVPIEIGKLSRTFTDVEVRVTESVYPEFVNEFGRESFDFAIGPIPEHGLGRNNKTSTLLDVERVVAVHQGHHKASEKSIRDFLSKIGWSALKVVRHSDLIGFVPRPLGKWAAKDIAVAPVAPELISAIRASAAGYHSI